MGRRRNIAVSSSVAVSKVVREMVVEGVETMGALLHRSNAVLTPMRPSSIIVTVTMSEQNTSTLKLGSRRTERISRTSPNSEEAFAGSFHAGNGLVLERRMRDSRRGCRDPRPFVPVIRKPSIGFETTKKGGADLSLRDEKGGRAAVERE